MGNLLDKFVEKIKIHFMFNNFFLKSDNVEKHSGDLGKTNDVTT